jgi:hypothetical protein
MTAGWLVHGVIDPLEAARGARLEWSAWCTATPTTRMLMVVAPLPGCQGRLFAMDTLPAARHFLSRPVLCSEAALIPRIWHFIRRGAVPRRCAVALCMAMAGAPAWAGPPAEPSVATMDHIGQRGGDLHILAASGQDTRLLVVYGYARLVGYDRDLNLVPDILSAVEVEDGRVFTLRLREGHRWSDGAPFTTEDFRYYWEDVANNEQLSPFGPP